MAEIKAAVYRYWLENYANRNTNSSTTAAFTSLASTTLEPPKRQNLLRVTLKKRTEQEHIVDEYLRYINRDIEGNDEIVTTIKPWGP